MYNETLRRNRYSDREGSTAEANTLARSTSAPHPSPIVRGQSPLVLQPSMTVSRSSTHSSPAKGGRVLVEMLLKG
ncbi:hypothetical protein OE88DRAFT_1650891 [Heliocybe sulcata]|uniref:Uncharacterized protein n=1 Tax=Heliocybe sulcata TaxID=5364 RepID=A0A5C3NM61_9AGAM|nr:hypothetical protein OE88DRAFT_1650891 [Heliocybe sulcata]